jgi:hypothetical protein
LSNTAALAALAEQFEDYVTGEEISAATGGKISIGTIGWYIRDRRSNGLAPHVRRNGKHGYLISASGFGQWYAGRTGKWV